jgi:hypothetical protein
MKAMTAVMMMLGLVAAAATHAQGQRGGAAQPPGTNTTTTAFTQAVHFERDITLGEDMSVTADYLADAGEVLLDCTTGTWLGGGRQHDFKVGNDNTDLSIVLRRVLDARAKSIVLSFLDEDPALTEGTEGRKIATWSAAGVTLQEDYEGDSGGELCGYANITNLIATFAPPKVTGGTFLMKWKGSTCTLYAVSPDGVHTNRIGTFPGK